jgi:L-histidine N-alpha-methyltransferase
MKNSAGRINGGDIITASNFLSQIEDGEIVKEIISGLQSEKKYISSRYFYNEKGSKLFEEITHLKEYYLTRTEVSILKQIAPEFSSRLNDLNIVELGSGDSRKISILLDAMSLSKREQVCYFPVDVSHSAIQESSSKLLGLFPEIKIHGIIANYISQFKLVPKVPNRLICFFGNTIGNMDIEQSSKFLLMLSKNMKPGDQLLIGFDMVKSKSIIEEAYNDREQITAAFNRNILDVVNDIIKTDFDLNSFRHNAFYNEMKSRIEMHLKAKDDLDIFSPLLNGKIRIKKGETIHTENSYKYTLNNIAGFAASSGLSIKNIFSDKDKWFSLVLFVK